MGGRETYLIITEPKQLQFHFAVIITNRRQQNTKTVELYLLQSVFRTKKITKIIKDKKNVRG